MQVAPLRSVDVAILHDRFSPINDARLRASVNALAAQAGLKGETSPLLGDAAPNVFQRFGDWYLLLSQSHTPLSPEGFQYALRQPATRMSPQDMSAAVREHRANTFITVGKGAPITPDIEQMFKEPEKAEFFKTIGFEPPTASSMTDLSDVKQAMEFAAALTGLVTGGNPARAIHWCMSDYLMSQDAFEAITTGGTGLNPLALRPNLFSSHNRLEPGKPVGMFLQGSQFLLGRPVQFEEAAVDVGWMLMQCAAFIEYCHTRGAVVGDGETIGGSAEEKILVKHIAPSKDNSLGTYSLVALEVPQFGISAAKPTSKKGFFARLLGR